MRELWEDHIKWTRNVIFCLVDNLPGTDQAVARLMQNQEDLGDILKPFYGEEVGDEFTRLLKEHIAIAAEVITATKAGNTDLIVQLDYKWTDNADQIALFLCTKMPKLDCAEMKYMMRYHIKLTNDEADFRINRMYDADIDITNRLYREIRVMSDYLFQAIVKQFPQEFI